MNDPMTMGEYETDGMRGVRDWIETIRDDTQPWGRWAYRTDALRPYTLQSSVMVVELLASVGGLESWTSAQRQEAIEYYRSCQDPESGLFKDPGDLEELHTGQHTWAQIWAQRTGSTLTALEALGAKPDRSTPEALFVDLHEIDGGDWTRQHLDWTNPWQYGETWSRTLKAHADAEGVDDHRQLSASGRHAFEALEAEILDPQSGTPSRRQKQPQPSVAMAGLFKVMQPYGKLSRRFPYLREALDSTLALQQDDGDWGDGDDMCLVWDAMWLVQFISHQLDHGYRFDDVRAAARRTADFLENVHRKPDGAYSFHRERALEVHQSIRLSRESAAVSDVLGTWMALACLRYADDLEAAAGSGGSVEVSR